MKAVLVLQEMPENCHQCPVDCAAYMASDQVTFKARLEGCPLRPMPERVYYGKDCSEWDNGYQCGVASVLRAIEGSEEDG